MHLLASFNASRPTSLQDVPQDWGTRAPGVGVPQTSPSSPNILIVEDEPADSSTMGYYGVVWRVHEPLLASLFWLALGRVLGWPDAVWEGPMPAPEDACARVLQKSCRSRAGQEATPPPAPSVRHRPMHRSPGTNPGKTRAAAKRHEP